VDRPFIRRDIYLKIEPLAAYSPLAPLTCARRYGRDCMFNQGHESGRIPAREILGASLEALVYREYFDSHYTQPVTAKLVAADVNEPPWDRRIPGAVLYAKPGERLHIHVLNGDPDDCHSFHLHGLRYGIDSDGAWPFGVASPDGRRSDEIRSGETWTYVFEATPETVGAWPFHDHVRNIQRNVNRGLFGGLIVRNPAARCPDYEVPMFVHQLQGAAGLCEFQSPTLTGGQTFSAAVGATPGNCRYHCLIHGSAMSGTIQIVTGGPASAAVDIKDNFFDPQVVTVAPGGTVTWTHRGGSPHIVFASGGGDATFCLNGRAYAGNTPTIVAPTGALLRWYVFNLDVGGTWHNFHPHSTRWALPVPPGGASDVHALSPVETFVTDTEVPPALRLPCILDDLQCDPPPDACRVRIKGDFLFHCHIEEHMMQGLAGLVRATQQVWVTDEIIRRLPVALPYDDGTNECPHADLMRCAGPRERPTPDRPHDPAAPTHHDPAAPAAGGPSLAHGMTMGGGPPVDMSEAAQKGLWELLPCDSQVLAVHAAVLHTGKVLFIGGSENSVPKHQQKRFRSVVFDYENGAFKTLTTPTDVFCVGHAFLADGRLLVAGGTLEYQRGDEKKGTLKGFQGDFAAYLFDPALEDYIRVGSMQDGRWYPSLLTVRDGHILTVSGLSATLQPKNAAGNEFSKVTGLHEHYAESAGWTRLNDGPDWPLYPHLFLLRDGRFFYSGGHVFGSAGLRPGWLNPATSAFTPMAPNDIAVDFDLDRRDQSASVLLPPAQAQRVMIMGGGGGDPETGIKRVHVVSPLAGSPKYVAAPSMALERIHLNAVILPDRTILVSGGEQKLEDRTSAALDAEIYDPAANTWSLAARATVPRLYHSIAVLLPDGRVLTAGSNPESADPGGGELRLELFHPPYLFRGPRPFIQSVPREWGYGSTIEIHTPSARDVKWISIVRPMATTHSWDSNQRLVDVPFELRGFCHLMARVPSEPTLAPPGWYMLFLVNQVGVPSVAAWVHLAPRGETPHPNHDSHG
jgi:FtsP/CotA-like multicopper oxidase with cupredoxin domain